MNKEETKKLLDYLDELIDDDDVEVEVHRYPDELEEDDFENLEINNFNEALTFLAFTNGYDLSLIKAVKNLLRKKKECSDELRMILGIELEE